MRLGKENERVWRKTGDKAEDYARGDENSPSCEPTSRLAGWSAGKRGQSPPPPTFYYPTGGGNQKMCDCGGVVFAPVSLLARSTHLVYGEPETDEHEQAAQRPHLALHPPHLLHRASLKRGGSITTFWFLVFVFLLHTESVESRVGTAQRVVSDRTIRHTLLLSPTTHTRREAERALLYAPSSWCCRAESRPARWGCTCVRATKHILRWK